MLQPDNSHEDLTGNISWRLTKFSVHMITANLNISVFRKTFHFADAAALERGKTTWRHHLTTR